MGAGVVVGGSTGTAAGGVGLLEGEGRGDVGARGVLAGAAEARVVGGSPLAALGAVVTGGAVWVGSGEGLLSPPPQDDATRDRDKSPSGKAFQASTTHCGILLVPTVRESSVAGSALPPGPPR